MNVGNNPNSSSCFPVSLPVGTTIGSNTVSWEALAAQLHGQIVSQIKTLPKLNPSIPQTAAVRLVKEILGDDLVTMMVLMEPDAERKIEALALRLRNLGYQDGFAAAQLAAEADARRAPRLAPTIPQQPHWGEPWRKAIERKYVQPTGTITMSRSSTAASGTRLG